MSSPNFLPQTELINTRYMSDGSTEILPDGTPETEITDDINQAMNMCMVYGMHALHEGDPPIGAVIIDHSSEQMWGAGTIDHSQPTILGHAELRAYRNAEKSIGGNLSNCTLVSNAQPCTTCTPPYAEGKIGRIVYAAPRAAIFAVAEIMRPRKINLPELLEDGHIDTIVTEGFRAHESLGMFAVYASRKISERGSVQA